MKILYIDCGAGASSEMIAGSLADLLGPETAKELIDSADIPGVTVNISKTEKSGITGTRIRVDIHGHDEGTEHQHIHRSLPDVLSVIDSLNISDEVRKDASAVYRILAKAEAEVHGKPIDQVHFHEVGALDAVTNIVFACMAIDRLNPDRILASPVRTGFGQVRCAHGILPVPAPATASVLKGIPMYAGDCEGEFCTPTGAAILKHFAEGFVRMPAMAVDRIGYGPGRKDLAIADMTRVFIGDASEE